MRLANSPQVKRLARELGLTARGNCVERIVAFAMDRARSILDGFDVGDLDVMFRLIANRLRLGVEFIRSDADITRIAAEYAACHSYLLQRLKEEFLQADTEGITLETDSGDGRSIRYLAVVDARGARATRAYFTAWHEVVHLLIYPPQLSFVGFRRTPTPELIQKDPIESLVDSIAGRLAFYDPIFKPALREAMRAFGGLTFDAIEAARRSTVPNASMHSAMVAGVRLCGLAALCVSVEYRYKKREAREVTSAQGTLALGLGHPQRQLRVVTVGRNEWAAAAGLEIFPNMRVPTRSIIATASAQQCDVTIDADEDQDWWETSEEGPLASLPIRVEAMRRGRFVYALVTARMTP